MAEKTLSLGNLQDIIIYDDNEFPDGIIAPNMRITQTPSNDNHAVRLIDLTDDTLNPNFNVVTANEVRTDELIVTDAIGFGGNAAVPPSIGWNTSNVTPTKTLDADTVTLPELADVVATLINYLLLRGDLKA